METTGSNEPKKLSAIQTGYCPACKDGVVAATGTVVRQARNMTLSHQECGNCDASVLLLAIVGQEGTVTSVGIMTDLVGSEIEDFWQKAQISSDDVISLHSDLDNKELVKRLASRA